MDDDADDQDDEQQRPADRVAWLRARLDAGALSRARLEGVARLGDPDAAAALGLVARLGVDVYAHGDDAFASLPVTDQVVVLAHALEGLARWWRRGAQPPAETRHLEPVVAAIEAATAWAAGPEAPRGERALEAGRHVVRFFEVIPPDTGGLDPGTYERALTHLAYAAGKVAYTCAPPDAPFRAPTQWDPPLVRAARSEEAERTVRADAARSETIQAIRGRAYLEALPPSEGGYEQRAEARARVIRAELQRTLIARLLA